MVVYPAQGIPGMAGAMYPHRPHMGLRDGTFDFAHVLTTGDLQGFTSYVAPWPSFGHRRQIDGRHCVATFHFIRVLEHDKTRRPLPTLVSHL